VYTCYFLSDVLRDIRCSVPAGTSRMDLKVSMAVRSCVFGLVQVLRGSLARMASVGCVWYVKVMGEVCLIVSRLFHLKTPVSQSRARCLRSLLEYLMGLHCRRRSASNSLALIVHCSICHFFIRASSTACDAAQRLAKISFLLSSGGV